MAFKGHKRASICACMMLVTCIFYIVSNAVPEWGTQRGIRRVKSTFGLWHTCKPIPLLQEAVCTNRPFRCSLEFERSTCNKILVSQVFVTIACIISGLSALSLFVWGVKRTDPNRILIIISKILPLVSFMAGLIGVAAGIAFITDSSIRYKVAASAIIGIIAVIINAITTVIVIIMVR